MKKVDSLFLLGVIASIVFGSTFVAGIWNQTNERKLLGVLFDPTKYDARIRPDWNETATGATKVSVNMYVRSIPELDDVHMNYKLQLTFRMQWMDKRLAFKHLNGSNGIYYLTLAGSDPLPWIPDVFFSNEIEAHIHDVLEPNKNIRIFRDGDVLYSMRISLTLSCPTNLKYFPFDRQTCSLRMASYKWTTADIILLWKKDDPVQITPDVHLPKFSLQQYSTDYCDSHAGTGVYSCLRVDFVFKRAFRHYLAKIYIPLGMLIVMAYLCLWLEQRRITVSFVILMVMSFSFNSYATEIAHPVVTSKTALDIWTEWCFIFAFIAFIICLIAGVLEKKSVRAERRTSSRADIEEIELLPEFQWKHLNLTQTYRGMPLWKKMLVAARLLYALSFLIFLVTYFFYIRSYTSLPEHDDYSRASLDPYYAASETQPGKGTHKLASQEEK